MQIEKMNDFFAARAETYDEHMLNNVEGCREGYIKMAELLPKGITELLDLGCGTGLELDEIFKTHPAIHVTGIDLTRAMLEKLKQKYPQRNIDLIHADYLCCDLGINKYDAAISFETMHHFTHEEKLGLYTKIYASVKPGRQYIECDYMLTDQAEEDFYYHEYKRLRKEQGIPEGEFYHYDTPCTVNNQIEMLQKAGFKETDMLWRSGNTTLVAARK